MLVIVSGGTAGYRRMRTGTRRNPPPAPMSVPTAPTARPSGISQSDGSGLTAASQVFRQELLGGRVELEPVLRLGEAMAFVGEEQVLVVDSLGLERGHDLFRFRLFDPRVKQTESEQIVAALKAKGIDHEYLLFPDEGHGFAKPENRLKFYAAAEKFLAKHLGGRCES